MATKTAVCPECGSEAAPGRFACADCGALLASVALTLRSLTSLEPVLVVAATPAAATTAMTDAEMSKGRADVPADPADVAGSAPRLEPTGSPEIGLADTGNNPDESDDDPGSEALAFDEDAPIAASRRRIAAAKTGRRLPPVILHDVAPEPDGAAAPKPLAAMSAGTAPPPITEPAPPSESPAESPAPRPTWPPVGTIGTIVRPEPRTPAGAYLPPSAILPPLDAPGLTFTAGSAAGATASVAVADAAGTAPVGRSVADLLGRGTVAIGDVFGSARIAPDAARRAVAAGAALAALSLVLPWVNSLSGTGPFTGYLDRWGLAGPGLWLVFLALLGLAAIALSTGRAAAWPVGLPALVVAAFLIGLIWPYAVGGSGRSIGIWTMAVGVVVLIVGGILERRSRPEPDGPAVQR